MKKETIQDVANLENFFSTLNVIYSDGDFRKIVIVE